MEYTKNVHVLLAVNDYEKLKQIGYEKKFSLSGLVREGVEKVIKKI